MKGSQPAPPRGGADEPNPPGDAAVVAAVLTGDTERYALLVRRYQSGLFRFALGMVGSRDAAADLVQESFVKAFTGLESCRDPDRFGAWLHRIVRNRCLDYLKHRRRLDYSLTDELGLAVATDDDVAERQEVRDAILDALATLPAAQREAFLLKHVEDRPYEEIAAMLDTSISALKMRVKRAREALQSRLARTLEL